MCIVRSSFCLQYMTWRRIDGFMMIGETFFSGWWLLWVDGGVDDEAMSWWRCGWWCYDLMEVWMMLWVDNDAGDDARSVSGWSCWWCRWWWCQLCGDVDDTISGWWCYEWMMMCGWCYEWMVMCGWCYEWMVMCGWCYMWMMMCGWCYEWMMMCGWCYE